MSGNTFGKIFKITTWGESHGKAVGVVLDGVPAGVPIKPKDIQEELDRRRPGKHDITSKREEKDEIEILSGIFEGKTIGTPISMLVWNRDVDSSPYEPIKYKPRPGHADLTYKLKYEHLDYRGGGRASGRETVARVAAGAVAKKILNIVGIEILGHVVEAAGIRVGKLSIEQIRKSREDEIFCGDPYVSKLMIRKIKEIHEQGDSSGGIVELIALNVPAGLGEPVFDKLEADIAKAIMSIGAVKGIEIGVGFDASRMLGSEFNDPFIIEEGKIKMKSNNCGGILGGISTGMPIVCRFAVKPTSSIGKIQETVDLISMKPTKLKVEGRHDPNITPRIVPVGEAMFACVLVDHMIRCGLIHPNKFWESPVIEILGRQNARKID
ncbi:MAG: chorismate synthase [Candidatus Hydrothermarchaeota archaeon]